MPSVHTPTRGGPPSKLPSEEISFARPPGRKSFSGRRPSFGQAGNATKVPRVSLEEMARQYEAIPATATN